MTRDVEISTWKFIEPGFSSQGPLGSGYPGGTWSHGGLWFQGHNAHCYADAVTKAWLRKNMDPVFGFPSLVRFSWSTSKKLVDSEAVDVEWYARMLCGGPNRF